MSKLHTEAPEILEYLTGAVREVMPSWSVDEVDDVVHTAFVQLLEMNVDIIYPYTLGYKIAQQKARDYMKQQSVRRAVQDSSPGWYDSVTPKPQIDDPAALVEGEAVLLRASSLTPLLSATLTEHYLKGKSDKEIADAQGTTEGAVRLRRHRAKTIITGESND